MKTEISFPGNQPGTRTGSASARVKQILVPVDFSEASRQALRAAAGSAPAAVAHLTLLHVLPPPRSFRRLDTTAEEHRRHHESKDRVREFAEGELTGLADVKIVIREGAPAAEIIRAAAEARADVIILGRHNHGKGLCPWLRAHTAERVARNAPCAVVVLGEAGTRPATGERPRVPWLELSTTPGIHRNPRQPAAT